jgi:hypothetical protein
MFLQVVTDLASSRNLVDRMTGLGWGPQAFVQLDR